MVLDLPPPRLEFDTSPSVTITCRAQPIMAYTDISFNIPVRHEAISSEHRAYLKQQEGMRMAKLSWGRHDGESRGVRRGSRPGRLERGYGQQAHQAKGWERKRKAAMATLR